MFVWLQALVLIQFPGWSPALILIHAFFFPHRFFFSCFACTIPCFIYLHLLTPRSITPPPPFPVNLPPLTLLMQPLTPEQTAVSDRRGAWEVQPTRQANSSYLTSHLAADRHGGSVQVHSPHRSSQQPLHPISMESDLSHGCNKGEMSSCPKVVSLWSLSDGRRNEKIWPRSN